MTELTCIVCPKGCRLKVDEDKDFEVSGNSCPRGEEYGKNELKNPKRVITSTVKTTSDEYPRCPVKTNGSIPKEKMFEAMELLDSVILTPPINIGDSVIENIFGTGIDFVSCKDINN